MEGIRWVIMHQQEQGDEPVYYPPNSKHYRRKKFCVAADKIPPGKSSWQTVKLQWHGILTWL
ncbi:hypothetical protein SUBVAR_05740 [Subdoligranulum variabile DSM 15176]|uniref:Uncharacterized protein n=1 Tax=Subdoligranulum variabile DSM 15176 TaxID=411471 RepID=D1PN25_9FIRM|nr:hypothetical protein SUBVAR_05740 [Subdoligranulum variabile DSM 15176]